MATIYAKAETVAVWLGPEAENSPLACELLGRIATLTRIESHRESLSMLMDILSQPAACTALACLFERDYWRRLWVVQEIFNAKSVAMYCGDQRGTWEVFKAASDVFQRHENDLKRHFTTNWDDESSHFTTRNRVSYANVLAHGGPASFPDVESLIRQDDASLLEVLDACRTKLAADPRDKVFAILGLLPPEVRDQFRPNYNLSVKDVYTNVVDYLLTTTRRLDVITHVFRYPLHLSPIKLPSWVPDWSQITQLDKPRKIHNFRADGNTEAAFRYLDDRGRRVETPGNVIEIEGFELGTITRYGIAIYVLNCLDNFLMAFLHWRALLLHTHDDDGSDSEYTRLVKEAFCETLCLGQVPTKYTPSRWVTVCYHAFASLIRRRLPALELDRELLSYADAELGLTTNDCKEIIVEYFYRGMEGRSFCLMQTQHEEDLLLGLGSGYLTTNDVVVIAHGCSTPIILRPDGNQRLYQYAGDIYVHGYMDGKAEHEWKRGLRELSTFAIH